MSDTKHELTIAETCSLFDCSRWTLARLIDRGLLRVVRVKGPGRDGAKRIPRSSLVALVRKCTIPHDLGGQNVATATDEEPDLDLEKFDDFAKRTGISKRVLDETARQRGFRHIKVGKTRYLNRAMRAEFLDAHTVNTENSDDLDTVRHRVQAQRNNRARRTG